MLAAACLMMVGAASVNHAEINPDTCAIHITANECFLMGVESEHKAGSHQTTCIQCLISVPGVATWGCTLGMMKEWCELGEEEAPASVLKEEREQQNDTPLNVERYKMLNNKKPDMVALRQKMAFSMKAYTKILDKFEQEHPSFSKKEMELMDALLEHGGANLHKLANDEKTLDNEKAYLPADVKAELPQDESNMESEWQHSQEYKEGYVPFISKDYLSYKSGVSAKKVVKKHVWSPADLWKRLRRR